MKRERRGAATQLPRHIKIETTHIGDTIKVESVTGEIIRTVIGTVARREYQGDWRVLYVKDGQELYRYHPELTSRAKVTLLHSAPTRQAETPTLFDLEVIA